MKGMIKMDEVASATLSVGAKSVDVAVKSVDLIAKLLQTLLRTKETALRLKEAKEIRKERKQQAKVSSRDITKEVSLKGGEVDLKNLLRNVKQNHDSVIPINDGLTESDKKFITSQAKKFDIPVAFDKKGDLYYPIIKGQDKNVYKHICTDLIKDKLANNASKEFTNIGLQDWEVPFTSDLLNKYNISAQFGQTADGHHFCLYQTSDEAVVKLARNEFKKMHDEVKAIDISENEDFFMIKDKNGHSVKFEKFEKTDLPDSDNVTESIQKEFNFDETKSRLLSARFGENYLSGEEKEKFFSDDIRNKFSSIKTNCVFENESILCKPFDCLRVKPKTDDIPKIVFTDEKQNFVVLHPERMNNKTMSSLIEKELGITDDRIKNALVDKARAVSSYYDSIENNTNYNYDILKSESKTSTYKVENSIVRNDKDTFTVSSSFHNYNDKNNISTSKPLTLSFSDKATAVEQLKALYIEQGIDNYTASQIAKECVKRAESQSADNVVQLESVKAEKFFGSDISSIKTADIELAMGDKKKIVSLSDEAKAKKDIMESFGVDEETAEATLETATREMSHKQKSKLQDFGYNTDKLNVYDADFLLERISKNHWKVPDDIKPDVYIPRSEAESNTEAKPDTKAKVRTETEASETITNNNPPPYDDYVPSDDDAPPENTNNNIPPNDDYMPLDSDAPPETSTPQFDVPDIEPDYGRGGR